MINDDAKNGMETQVDRLPGVLGDRVGGRDAGCQKDVRDRAAYDGADDEQQHHQAEYLPAIAFGEGCTSAEASEWAEPFDDAARQRNIPHRVQNDRWNEHKQEPEYQPDALADQQAQDREKAGQARSEGVADLHSLPAHDSKCAMENYGLSEDIKDKAKYRYQPERLCHASGLTPKGGLLLGRYLLRKAMKERTLYPVDIQIG